MDPNWLSYPAYSEEASRHEVRCGGTPATCRCVSTTTGELVVDLWAVGPRPSALAAAGGAPLFSELPPPAAGGAPPLLAPVAPGKWQVFPPDADTAERCWLRVRALTAGGGLGFAAKAQFKSREKPALMLYVPAAGKDALQGAALAALQPAWPAASIRWKDDEATARGNYSAGYFVMQRFAGSRGLFVWHRELAALRGALPLDQLLPREHPLGSHLATAHALVGDAWLRAAVFQELLPGFREELLERGDAAPGRLTEREQFAVTNELLAQHAELLLEPLLAPAGPLPVAHLRALKEHGRATAVEAAVYAVFNAVRERERAGGGDGGGGSGGGAQQQQQGQGWVGGSGRGGGTGSSDDPVRDLAQHLLVLTALEESTNWKGALCEMGGECREAVAAAGAAAEAGAPRFVGVALLAGASSAMVLDPLTLEPVRCEESTKTKAHTRAARALLEALGWRPLRPGGGAGGAAPRLLDVAKYVVREAPAATAPPGKPPQVNFKGALLELGGALTDTRRIPGSSDTEPRFASVATLRVPQRGLERLQGPPMPTKQAAEASAAAAALCRAGLISARDAALALAHGWWKGAGGGGGGGGTAPASPAPSPPIPLEAAVDWKGMLLARGGGVGEPEEVRGAPSHAQAFTAEAWLGDARARGPEQPSKKKAQAAAARLVLERVSSCIE